LQVLADVYYSFSGGGREGGLTCASVLIYSREGLINKGSTLGAL
jgi:hypothetical protein